MGGMVVGGVLVGEVLASEVVVGETVNVSLSGSGRGEERNTCVVTGTGGAVVVEAFINLNMSSGTIVFTCSATIPFTCAATISLIFPLNALSDF